MPPAQIHIQADRGLAFEVVTAFGATKNEHAPRILRWESDGRLFVEFHTAVPTMFGGSRRHRTVERVTLIPPERVEFEGVEGPLPLLWDRFTFEDVGGCTDFRYTSTFGLRGWLAGWLLGQLYVRPLLGRFMRQHVEELRQTVEARATRSHVYPQPMCMHLDASP